MCSKYSLAKNLKMIKVTKNRIFVQKVNYNLIYYENA